MWGLFSTCSFSAVVCCHFEVKHQWSSGQPQQTHTIKTKNNRCDQVLIGFGFISEQLIKWREIFCQSQSVTMQNQSDLVDITSDSIESCCNYWRTTQIVNGFFYFKEKKNSTSSNLLLACTYSW